MELHEFIDDGSDPGNCAVCHFFHTEPRGPKGERPEAIDSQASEFYGYPVQRDGQWRTGS
jgi:hypothetical protein